MPQRCRLPKCRDFRSTHSDRSAALLKHIAYRHCHRLKRLAVAEATMEQHLGYQPDLLEVDKHTVKVQGFDPAVRFVVTSLLKVLLNECVTTPAQTIVMGAINE
jgi:hypothetical protein